MKRRKARSVRYKYLAATMGAAAVACLAVGLILFSGSVSALRDAGQHQTLQKALLLTRNLSAQRRAVQEVALHMAADVTYRKNRVDENAYRNVELLKDLPMYASHFPLSDDFFILYNDSSLVYLSSGYTNQWDFFVDSRGFERGDALLGALRGAAGFSVLPAQSADGACALFVMPLYTMGRGVERGRAVLALIVSGKAFLKYAETFTGDMPGAFAVYYQGTLRLVAHASEEEAALFAGTSLEGEQIRDMGDGRTLYIGVSQDESFHVAYLALPDTWARESALRAVNAVYAVVAVLFVLAGAAALGYAQYIPVLRLKRRLGALQGGRENGDEFGAIASFLEQTLSERERMRKDLQAQYETVRRQFLRLLLGGDATACALARRQFMGVCLDGPMYLAILLIPKDSIVGDDRDLLAASVGELSDGGIRYYFTPTLDAQRFAVVVNLPDEDWAEDALDCVHSLLPESGGFLVGASLPFATLERLPDALAQAAAACVGMDEPPDGTAHSPFWYNPALAGEIAAALRTGDAQGALDGYGAFSAQAEAHTTSFPYERAAHFRLLDEMAALAQGDAIRLDWRLADRVVSAYSRGEMRASLQALLRAAAAAYQSEASVRLGEERASGGANGSRAAALIRHIQTNYADPDISLDSLSQAFGLSNRYISNLIREATGVPYKDYLTGLRVRRARELLAEGGRTVTEVSAMVGYASLASFIKMFRSVTGSAPARFARESRRINA